eukprot:6206064-Pleurochrysis_carterae.AAC.6
MEGAPLAMTCAMRTGWARSGNAHEKQRIGLGAAASEYGESTVSECSVTTVSECGGQILAECAE